MTLKTPTLQSNQFKTLSIEVGGKFNRTWTTTSTFIQPADGRVHVVVWVMKGWCEAQWWMSKMQTELYFVLRRWRVYKMQCCRWKTWSFGKASALTTVVWSRVTFDNQVRDRAGAHLEKVYFKSCSGETRCRVKDKHTAVHFPVQRSAVTSPPLKFTFLPTL